MAKEYQDFVKTCGYGQLLGICGVNCRHTFYSYYPEFQDSDDDSIDYEENKKAYQLSQRQRAMERSIRENKRKISALESCGIKDDKTMQRISELKQELKQKNVDYKNFCFDNHLSQANWRKQI